MNKKLKLIIACIYILCMGILLFTVFSYLDLKDLTSYTYIRDNTRLLIDLKNENLILFTVIFFIFAIIWVLLLGFGSPIAILSGFLFGKWYGTAISVIALTGGSALLYLLAKYYLSDFIIERLSKKIEKYKNLFSKNELLYFFIFRFVGGAGIPFFIQNVLPVIFDMKIKNYIYATLFGLIPTVFIVNSLGSGVNNLIGINEDLDYYQVLQDPGIYIPLIGFIIFLYISFMIKKKIFKQ